jgi:oxygen-independent coproporphyrinogen-3 oxidase
MESILYQLTPEQKALYMKLAALPLPRHTSYPAANFWKEIDGKILLDSFLDEVQDKPTTDNPVSIYLHLPFCSQLCYYCACNKYIVGRDDSHASDYSMRLIEGLECEIERVFLKLGRLNYSQLHLGGGTPTWLSPSELSKVLRFIDQRFNKADDFEASVELDPRVTLPLH